MNLLYVFLFLLPAVLSHPDPDWESFKHKFQRNYESSDEESYRKTVFLQNKQLIDRHNQKHADGLSTFTLAINQFTDMTNDEFQEELARFESKPVPIHAKEHKSSGLGFDVVTVDWRQVGCVPLVKDQSDCIGGGWAFSAITGLEFINCRVKETLVKYSEQNLLDCTTDYGNDGCNGGTATAAFQYAIDNRGVDTEASYPFTGKNGSQECNYDVVNRGGGCAELIGVPSGNEDVLAEASSLFGPIAAVIDASQPSFQFYSTGVYIDENCSSTSLNHGISIVGYGFQNEGNYWIVRNSWGYTWGDNGYILMAKDRNNQCGIASQASYCLY